MYMSVSLYFLALILILLHSTENVRNMARDVYDCVDTVCYPV